MPDNSPRDSATTLSAYYFARIVYNLYFHPLSKYPGPRLAASTNLWWAYKRYANTHGDGLGDVVRIAPNEVVYITLQAAKDGSHFHKNLELFVQVGYGALDTGDGGISGEPNPVRHREVAKKLAPAFSTRNLKAKEVTIHKHIDLFNHRLEQWTDWLGLDLSADMTYGDEMNEMRDIKDSIMLSLSLKLKLFLIYVEQMLPSDKPISSDEKEIYHLQNPLANPSYSVIFFLLKEPDVHAALVSDVRATFSQYADITMTAVGKLKYLQACVQESLRMHWVTLDGLPRISPGAVVDRQYIPQGRSPRYFAEPLKFCPKRWLSSDHPRFYQKFECDNLKASKPFSQELRGCPCHSDVPHKSLWSFDGLETPSFDNDFKFLVLWGRPQFFVRFKPVSRGSHMMMMGE
ncbi:cytochrome P450 [Xylariaceae sp. FL0255]|nr:cytochrome P450 [Xylariaceae sp. FL0255]